MKGEVIINAYDNLLDHSRTIIKKEWNEDLKAYLTYVVASKDFFFKYSADRWSRKQVTMIDSLP